MATYLNDLRLSELATGEGSGTWGVTTNTNLELIGEALGYGTQDCFATDADATTTVADGASDPARAMYFKVTSSATLTATRVLTIAPNTVSRVMFIENATTGSQSIAISQGSGANVTIATGKTAVVYLDGAGSTAAVVDAMAGVDPGVTDTLAEVLVAGNTSGGTNIELSTTDKVQFRDTAIYINSSADGQLDIVADTEVQIAATTIDVNGTLAFDSLKGTDTTTVTTIKDEDDMSSDSATALATQQSIKAYVDSQVGSFDTLAEVLAQGNTTGGTNIAVSTGDDITFADDSKAIFGAGPDLRIYHDGSNSYINDTSGTGNLYIASNQLIINNAANNENMARFAENGAATLYYDGSAKLATTATGVDITGTATMDGLTVDGQSSLNNIVTLTATNPRLRFIESDTTDVNTDIRNSDGDFQIGTINDAVDTITTRFNIDHATGDISFYEDTGVSQSFFWDASTERLGVGTITPNTPVDAQLSGIGGLPVSSGTAQTYGSLRVGATSFNTILDMGTAGATGAWLQASDRTGLGTNYSLLLNPNGGNVGIGTSSPSGKLDVYTSATRYQAFTTSAADLEIVTNNNTNPAVLIKGTGTADLLNVFDNTTEVFTILDGGNVGIGTDSPTGLLHLSSSAPAFYMTDTTNNTEGVISMDNAGSLIFNADLNNEAGSSNIRFAVDGSEAMRIDASGNLLVGATTTTAGNEGMVYFNGSSLRVTRDSDEPLNLDRLTSDGTIAAFKKDGTTVGSIGTNGGRLSIGSGDVNLNFNASANSMYPISDTAGTLSDGIVDIGASSARFKDLHLSGVSYNGDGSATAPSISFGADTNTGFYRVGSDQIGFVTGGTIKAKLDASGNLLVATTDTTLYNNTSGGGAAFIVAGDGIRLDIARDGDVATFNRMSGTGTLLEMRQGGAAVGTISVTASATAYNTSSDQRLKENIVDAPSASDDIDAIQVRSFDWKADGSHQKYGMVAQELQTVAPEAVSVPEDPEEMMGVDYSKLVPMLVKEIQSLRARVAALES
jgi:hypothetical protein